MSDVLGDLPLKAIIKNDQLQISVGVNILCFAAETGRAYGLGDIRITNRQVFLKEVLNEINAESEDGSTMLHHMLDQAVSNAIENGAMGVEYEED
jgi:hypothetical protein